MNSMRFLTRFARSHYYSLPRYAVTRGYVTLPATKVEQIILDSIKATGPISFATYMSMCLSHPTEGYYMKASNHVFGPRGDFITSPEISQVFGELIGIWLVSQWQTGGQSRPTRLVELGPGRGTLMDDILRVISRFDAPRSALKQIHLVETSLSMRGLQKKKLLPVVEKQGWDLVWHDSIEDIPQDTQEYTWLVAHEFFDALPVHTLVKSQNEWKEVLIASGPDPAVPQIIRNPHLSLPSSSSIPPQHRLRQIHSSAPTASSKLLSQTSPRFRNLPEGSRVEVSPASYKIARRIGELVGAKSAGGGSALLIDYGGDKAYGNSLRAFKDHKIVDIFHRPGECDLTANVDFAYLKEAVADFGIALGPISQADFLNRMGMPMRVDALQRAAKSEERRQEIGKAAGRLVDQTGMGKQYQLLGLTSRREETWPFINA